MKLTDAQERLAEAYQAVEALVWDDLLIFASDYDARGNKPTGMDVYAHIQRRLTMRRRAHRRPDPKPAKRVEIHGVA